MSIGYGNTLNKVVGTIKLIERVYFRGYGTSTQTFNFTRAPASGELIILSSWWDRSLTVNTPTGFTSIVSNEGGSEYPEGETFYKIAGGSESTSFSVTSSAADDCAGVALLFKSNVSISSVSIGNTAFLDGPSALNSTIAADSPAVVAYGSTRLKLYFLTGRQQPAYIQDPTPNFVNATGWIYEDGNVGSTNDTSGGDNMDWAYKILEQSVTDVSEQVTTNDTGRQGHHLLSITLS